MSRLIVAVAVVAVDLVLILEAEKLPGSRFNTGTPTETFAYALVPSLSLLGVAAVSGAIGLRHHKKAPPFSTGYLVLGSLASFCFCFDVGAGGPGLHSINAIYDLVYDHPLEKIRNSSLKRHDYEIIVIIILWALPQVVSGLIGGVLAARYRLTVVQGDRVGNGGEG